MTSKTSPIAQETSNKTINGFAKRIRASYGKSDALVHEGGVAALEHFNTFGDCTGMGRIYDAMPKSTRRSLFVLWALRYGGVVIGVTKGKVNAHKAKEGSKGYKAKVDLEGAKANPWNEMPEVENEPKVLDFDETMVLVDQLANRIDRMLKGEAKSGTIANADKARAAALVTALKALRIPEVETVASNNDEPATADVPVQIAA